MIISVVLPTIPGREQMYQQVRDAYLTQDYRPHTLELHTERNHPTVGCAWQAGAEKAQGDYIHMGNDDCVPAPGWWRHAVEAVDRGFVPSPLVRNSDGYPQSLPEWGHIAEDWTPVTCVLIPFLGRQQWEKIQPLLLSHYYSDNFITERAKKAGWPCAFRTGYAFTHLWAVPGRGAGMSESERMAYDKLLVRSAMERVELGTWDKPWPPDGGRLMV